MNKITTFGIPANDKYTLNQEEARKKETPIFVLSFVEATTEFTTALDYGLECYGSGIAAWRLAEIVQSNGNANKQAQMWQLYVSQVCGASYSKREINKAWNGYSAKQKEFINKEINEYLEYLTDSLEDYR